jgi:hypothetical protein
MRPSVYLETSIVSYLAAFPSRDLVTAAHQQITHTWWRERRPAFEIFASQVVPQRAGADAAHIALAAYHSINF